MQNRKMKIRPFSVVSQEGKRLESVLELLEPKNLADKNRIHTSGIYIRIEDILSDKGGLWFMNFAKARDIHGPGTIKKDRPLEPIDLEEGESFGEDVAALYCVETRHLVVQQNQRLVRMQEIQDYLNWAAGDKDYRLDPVPDQELDQKFRNAERITKLHFRGESIGFGSGNIQGGLGKTLDFAHDEIGGYRVEMIISAKPNKKGNLTDAVRNVVERLTHAEGISKLDVGITDPDQKSDLLDFLDPKMEDKYSIDLDHQGRMPLQKRYDALRAFYHSWRTYFMQRRTDIKSKE